MLCYNDSKTRFPPLIPLNIHSTVFLAEEWIAICPWLCALTINNAGPTSTGWGQRQYWCRGPWLYLINVMSCLHWSACHVTCRKRVIILSVSVQLLYVCTATEYWNIPWRCVSGYTCYNLWLKGYTIFYFIKIQTGFVINKTDQINKNTALFYFQMNKGFKMYSCSHFIHIICLGLVLHPQLERKCTRTHFCGHSLLNAV